MHSGLGIAPGRSSSSANDAARVPLQLTRLVGREQELRELERLLLSHRLITLTGTGGTGKTRLAAEFALRLDAAGEEPLAWVELAPCQDPGLVEQQTAAALSVRETSSSGMTGALVEALRDRKLVLILDNCEHLVDASAQLASTLLRNCPALRMIATSREPLGVPGERLMPVQPLPLAPGGSTDPAVLARTDAVALFVDRAAAVAPGFELNASNAGAVANICRRLDGLPLAIELAAARMRHLTPEQIAERLEHSFALLSGGSRTTLAHHRTLHAAIDWSFALLSDREQAMLARLSVFAGTFSLECVEQICADELIGRADILELISGLVDKSLVVSTPCPDGARYNLLGTIRQYAAEHLPDPDRIRRRHALAFLDVARAAADELQIASSSRLAALDPEHDNFRVALAWGLDHEPETIALPLAAACRYYWYYRILWSEGWRWLTRVLERTADRSSYERTAVISVAGAFALYLGDSSARSLLEEAETKWRQHDEFRQLAFTLSALAQLHGAAGDLDRAEEAAGESVALARKDGLPYDIAYCLTNAAGFVAQLKGDLERADRYLDEAERIWTRHPIALPFALNARAILAIRRGDERAAEKFARRALQVARAENDLWFSSRSLRVLAFTTAAADPTRAARLLGAADGMLRAMSAGILLHERDLRDRLVERLRSAMTEEDLEAALLEGGDMTAEEAAAMALAPNDGPILAPARECSLRIGDLGPLQVMLNGTRLTTEGRAYGRARELLAFLASHPGGCSREEVGVALWPEASTEQVRNSFHVTMHRLRRMLGRPDAIRLEEGKYGLDHNLTAIVDSREFEREVNAELRGPSNRGEVDRLQAALARYRGDYLQGEDIGEWCLPMRAHLRGLYLRALFALGELYAAEGRYAGAADAFTLLLSRDPYDEAASRQLMICHARRGARSESLMIYRRLEERLRDELASSPQPETASLFRRLQLNETV